ncbi:Uncharacterised protein [Moraxella bovis]|uniref:RanBP2-type domain-containing protein n=1 Tax=Moraxella bovis TaxID=476 RepID=A0A378PS55_MORBO|nr:Uncharacterised protein [Moraxella bovis]
MKFSIFTPIVIRQVWTCSNPNCGAKNDDSKSVCAYCGK